MGLLGEHKENNEGTDSEKEKDLDAIKERVSTTKTLVRVIYLDSVWLERETQTKGPWEWFRYEKGRNILFQEERQFWGVVYWKCVKVLKYIQDEANPRYGEYSSPVNETVTQKSWITSQIVYFLLR